MVLEGNIRKDNKLWLIEVPSLDLITQGHSKRDAFAMLRDAIRLLIDRKDFKIKLRLLGSTLFLLESDDDTAMLALMLKRQRNKHDLSIADMAKRLHVRSKNAYAQYEQGKSQPSLTKVQEFLWAMSPRAVLAFTVFEERAQYQVNSRNIRGA